MKFNEFNFNTFALVAAKSNEDYQDCAARMADPQRMKLLEHRAAWVTTPVCKVAHSLVDSTQLYPTGQEFTGVLGFADPFVSSTGISFNYVKIATFLGDSTVYIFGGLSRHQKAEWELQNGRSTANLTTRNPTIEVRNGRALPRDMSQFVMPGEAFPGLTCADIQPLARYVMACLQLLASDTVTEVVDEITVNPHSGSGRSRRKGGGGSPVVIRSHGLTRKVRQSMGTGRKATKRWWVRGHFRNQAYGPKLAYRRRIFIAPHTSGSKSAPEPETDTRPVVEVLRKTV